MTEKHIVPKPILNQADEFKGEAAQRIQIREHRQDLQNSSGSFEMGNGISNLEDHLGYWLRCLSNYIHDSFADRLAKYDISVPQWVVLRVIYDQNGITLNHAAEIIGVDKSSLSRMVERLVGRGLLERSERHDRRSIGIELSEVGLELVPKLAALADKNEEVFFKSLENEEREELLKVIKKLLDDNGFEGSKRGLVME